MRWVLFMAAAALVAGQKPAHLEGTVTSSIGGVVRKATVRLRPFTNRAGRNTAGTYVDTTDDQGRFLFDNLPPGSYGLTVEHPSYVTQGYHSKPGSNASQALQVEEGEAVNGVDVVLIPTGVISGRLTDDDGDPVQATVLAMRVTYINGQRRLQMHASSISDDQGNFRLSRLPPGKYYVLASRVNAQENTEIQGRTGKRSIAADTYYPGATSLSQASGINVLPGSEVRGDLRMQRTPASSIRGRVVAPGDFEDPVVAPITVISMDAPSGSRRANASPGADGTFEIRNIRPGSYMLEVTTPIRSRAEGGKASITGMLVGRKEVTVGDTDVEGVVLDLMPAPEITGTVKFEGGGDQPAVAASIAETPSSIVAPNGGRILIDKKPAVSASTQFPRIVLQGQNGTNSAQGRAGENGALKITNANPGQYTVSVAPLAGDTYIKSIRYAGQDVTHSPLEVRVGVPGTLDIVLSRNAGNLSGEVKNDAGDAVPFATVALWPKSPGSAEARSTEADQNGRYQLGSLAPGDYYVAAWDALDTGLASYAPFLDKFTRLASSVSIQQNARATADVKLLPQALAEAAEAALP